jgi:homoaconitate hydratase
VIAASFSQTYKRNAFNNGFVVFECPELVDELRASMKPQIDAGQLTIATDDEAVVSFERGDIRFGGKSFTFAPLGRVPQEIIAAGGTEALIRDQLAGA